ncbi:MAG: FHA domain-containing protein [Coriobacteriales bacterium]|jgi:hypothetical protein|nr:FHA domain-containing protein [Coriobacteriales bacterium]
MQASTILIVIGVIIIALLVIAVIVFIKKRSSAIDMSQLGTGFPLNSRLLEDKFSRAPLSDLNITSPVSSKLDTAYLQPQQQAICSNISESLTTLTPQFATVVFEPIKLTESASRNSTDTTVLNSQMLYSQPLYEKSTGQMALRRTKTNEVFPLTFSNDKQCCQNGIYVGKAIDNSGFTISDNPAISRRHITIAIADGNYVISDLWSSNGTWIGDKRLESGVGYVLMPGDIVRLADENFTFEACERSIDPKVSTVHTFQKVLKL